MDYLTDVAADNRWDPVRFIAFRQGTFDPSNCYLIDAVLTLPAVGEYTVLDDVNRPDMICAAIYNNDMTLWWLLMIYNGLWDFTAPNPYPNIPIGSTIRYFGRDALERVYFTLRAKQVANPP